MSPLFLLLPALFLGGVISTISGGGLGIISILVGTFFFDIRTNIAVTSLLTVAIQLVKIAHFHKFIRWDITKWYVITGVPASFIGGVLLYYIPERIPEIGMGIFCILFIIFRLTGFSPKVSTTNTAIATSGAINGFVGGMIGNSSLMRMPVLLSMGVSKEIFVGTSAMVSFLMNIGKLTAYIPNIPWSKELGMLLVCAIPVLLLGVWLGKVLLKYVSSKLFEGLLLCVILFGALRLLFVL